MEREGAYGIRILSRSFNRVYGTQEKTAAATYNALSLVLSFSARFTGICRRCRVRRVDQNLPLFQSLDLWTWLPPETPNLPSVPDYR